MDDRIALLPQTQLPIPAGRHAVSCTILSECGRGASCLVYNAMLVIDSICIRICLRECYPRFLHLVRDSSGEIRADDGAAFAAAQDRFQKACEMNARLQTLSGLINKVPDIFGRAFAVNGTLYAVTQYHEGRCYRDIPRETETAGELTTRMLAVAKSLERIHSYGWLYLDLKPSNIFFLEETDELAVFFDFDSMLEKSVLSEDELLPLFSSPAYAAPEVLQNGRQRIDERADIYSIGAVMYERLTGHTPSYDERQSVSSLSLHTALGESFVCSVRDFLSKTLASPRNLRYESMQRCITALQVMKGLASDAARIDSNFSFTSSCVLHTEEIGKKIGLELQNNDVVFLCGLGGLGKTTAACAYAASRRDAYSRIVFLKWNQNMQVTMAALPIINASANLSSFVELLPQPPEKPLLLILDNYNEAVSGEVLPLLTCGCKIIVTTRITPDPGYEYPTLQIEVMPKEQLLNLYLKTLALYRKTKLSQEETNSVLGLIDAVDGHTMSVSLLARLQATQGCTAQALADKLREQEGIMLSTGEVGQRKDGSLSMQTVAAHLSVLFNTSDFSLQERQLLACIDVLGDTQILQGEFLSWLPEQTAKLLPHLFALGWVSEEKGKLYLHEVLLDLLFVKLRPNASRCAAVLTALTKKLRNTANFNRTQNAAWAQLCERVRSRIAAKPYTGQYAAFDAAYACYRDAQAVDISRCEKYVQQHTDIDKRVAIECALGRFNQEMCKFLSLQPCIAENTPSCLPVFLLKRAWDLAESESDLDTRLLAQLQIVEYAAKHTAQFDTSENREPVQAVALIKANYSFIEKALHKLTATVSQATDDSIKRAVYRTARDFYHYNPTEDETTIHDEFFADADKAAAFAAYATAQGAMPYQLPEYFDCLDEAELEEDEPFDSADAWTTAQLMAETHTLQTISKATLQAPEDSILTCVRAVNTFEETFYLSKKVTDAAVALVQTKLREYTGNDAYLIAEATDFLASNAWGPASAQQEQYFRLRKQCDSVLLAEHHSEGVSFSEAIRQWRIAAGYCEEADKPAQEQYCYEQAQKYLQNKLSTGEEISFYDIETIKDAIAFTYSADAAAARQARGLMRRLLAAYLATRKENKRKPVIKQLLWLSAQDEKAGQKTDACEALMLALLVASAESPIALQQLNSEAPAELEQEFMNILQAISQQAVDMTVEICERLERLSHTTSAIKTACAAVLSEQRDRVLQFRSKKALTT